MESRRIIGSSEFSLASSIRESASVAARLEESLSSQESAELTLHRALSVRSVVSTSSSLARWDQEAADEAAEAPSRATFHFIGRGSFGFVFEHPGTPSVLKLEQFPVTESGPEDEGNQRSLTRTTALWDEMLAHKAFSDAFDKFAFLGIDVRIPEIHDFIAVSREEWWEKNAGRFPKDTNITRQNILRTERIFPVSQPVREALIDLYSPESLSKDTAKKNPNNKACLIRLYMGRVSRPPRFFNMRNFPLCWDQMEHLSLETDVFARAMAQTLAVAHWEAGLDARDVEFVLGSSPEYVRHSIPPLPELQAMEKNTDLLRPSGRSDGYNFMKRAIHVWCLDFNQCRFISRDQAGMQACVDAYFLNDPYFPRPDNEQMWNVFSSSYLETSTKVLQHRIAIDMGPRSRDVDARALIMDLPSLFVQGIEARFARRKPTESETSI